MSKGAKILIAVLVVIVIAGGLIVLFMPQDSAKQPSNKVTENNQSQTEGEKADVTVTYDGSSFKLSATTIKSGGKVRVENTSSKNLEFESDPHPAHSNNPELNAGNIGPGKSSVFTLTAKGKWGFHNHLNASQKGELIVE